MCFLHAYPPPYNRKEALGEPLSVELEAPDISLKKMQFLNKIGVSD